MRRAAWLFAFLVMLLFSLNAKIPPVKTELYFGSVFSLPLNKGAENYKASYNTGVKIRFGELRINLISGMKSTTFGNIACSSPFKYLGLQNLRGGVTYSFNTSWINVRIDAGTLSFSNGVSRLGKPAFYSSSALTRSSGQSAGIGVSLPSWLSSRRPLSAFLALSGGKRLSALPAFQAVVTAEGEVYASVCKKFSAGRLSSGSVSITGGLFDCTQRTRLSLDAELNLTFTKVRIFAAGGMCQSAFGDVYFWGRARCYVTIGDAMFHAFLFAADPRAIYTGALSGSTVFQAALNPQYTARFGKKSLKAGVLFYGVLRQDAGAHFMEYTARLDCVFSASKYKISSYAKVSYDTEDGYAAGGARVKLSIYCARATLNQSVSYRRTGECKNTYTLNFSASPKDIVLRSVGASVSAAEEGGAFDSLSVSLRAAFKWKCSALSVNGSFALKVSL